MVPITGGSVTYYKRGTVSTSSRAKYHDGSGLSLTGGHMAVELTDFVATATPRCGPA